MLLLNTLENALARFPKTFDSRLIEGFKRLATNAPKNFIVNRSPSHILKVLIIQFFLQKKIESAIKKDEYPFFVRLFQKNAHLCLTIILPTSEDEHVIGKGYLLKAIQQFIPATHEVKDSCFRWLHPELPYMSLYLEIQKLRGKKLSSKEVRSLGYLLTEQLIHYIPVYTPALFWPFNEEEAFQQVQMLQKEIHHVDDLPQVTIYFREQSKPNLEFLINLVRPQSDVPIDQAAKKQPSSINFFQHFYKKINRSFPLEAWCFSLTIPSQLFYENNAINLLYARRHIAKYVEQLVGPFRDFNGGLLEKQQETFEPLKIRLAKTIPDFHLFGEKVLYALKPIEMRLSLSFNEAKILLQTFSRVMKENRNTALKHPEGVLIVKTTHFSSLVPLVNKAKEWKVTYAQLSLSNFYYLCVLDKKNIYLSQLETLLKQPIQIPQKSSILRLTFQEGEPPSINPHYVSGDIRCRVLSKLLFEGLTRIDAQGMPQLASAKTMTCSQDGLTYIFKLRSFRWSNGEKFTAFHYVNSWHSILQNPSSSSYPESLALFVIKNVQKFREKKCSIEQLGIYAHDAETLEIQLEWPDPIFLHKLAQPMFFPAMGKAQEPKWFNGPYLIQKQDSRGIVLEYNPYYWDHPSLFFKQVQIDWLSDTENPYSLFQEGKIDWLGTPFSTLSSEMITQLQKTEKLRQQPAARALWIYLNTKSPALSSAKIRQALSLAIDRSLITEHIYPYNTSLYTPLPHSLSLCPNTLSDNAVAQSKRLFEAGLIEIGFSKETFPPLTFSCPTIVSYKQLAEHLQETWGKVLGIKIFLELEEWNVFRSRLEKGEFQIGISGVSPLSPDPSELLERLNSPTNYYRAKLDLAKKIPQQRIQFLREAEELLLEEMPIIPICNLDALFAHNPKLKGYVFDHAGCVDFRWAYLQ